MRRLRKAGRQSTDRMGKRAESGYEKMKVIPIKAGPRPGFEANPKEVRAKAAKS